mmetsp:Transcript_48160/g.96970  ORF Transcript_48160/g.96970 Transcript_48160/m.96970 type:complete len:167 (+) Transcript_48160:39-539(+)
MVLPTFCFVALLAGATNIISVQGLALAPSARPRFSVHAARVLKASSSPRRRSVKLASDAGEAELQTAKEDSMANLEARKEEVAKKVAQAVEAAEAMKTEDTALYESDSDSVIKARAESVLSSTMKDKLKAELRSQGADANTAFNPFPFIFVGVAILVATAGSGIFF